MDLQLGRQQREEVAHFFLVGARNANILLKVDEESIDEVRPNLELIVQLVNLLNARFVNLTRLRELTEKRRQLTEEGHEDGDAKDDNDEDPAQLEHTRLRYVSVADSGDRDD